MFDYYLYEHMVFMLYMLQNRFQYIFGGAIPRSFSRLAKNTGPVWKDVPCKMMRTSAGMLEIATGDVYFGRASTN